MTRNIHLCSRTLSPWTAAFLLLSVTATAGNPTAWQVRGGTVKFDASTNLSAISIHGQSSAINAELTLRRNTGSVDVETLRAVVDPKTLSTGMSLRDQHMRQKIFTTNNQLPPLEFVGEKTTCPELPPNQDVTCQITGNLSLRGVGKPFSMRLRIRSDSKGFRVAGDGVMGLSVYGINPPCQLGVCVTDEVKLHLEFQVREALGMRSGGVR